MADKATLEVTEAAGGSSAKEGRDPNRKSNSEPDAAKMNTTADASLSMFGVLSELCENNIKYFASDETESGLRIHGAFVGITDHIRTAVPLVKETLSFVEEYDFDPSCPGNGYRSFVHVVDCCVRQTLKLARHVMENRSSILFRKAVYAKEVEAYNHLLASLCTCLKHCHTLREWTSGSGDLFPTDHSVEELLAKAETINQFCFYGRCLGFQFCNSMKPLLRFISIAMAGYSEGYYTEGNTFSKTTCQLYTSGKYMLDPELRARRIVNISQNSSVDFCKAFWFLAETQLMQSIPSLVGMKIKVSRVITLPPEPIRLQKEKSPNEFVDIPIPTSHGGPGPILARLISAVKRRGMIGEKVNPRSTIHPPSNALLFHCHGGGFVAQSSKSHESYLREWAVTLNVPILSIDYSLAPEAPFPRALEEVFYAYCWALNNIELLGTTGEKIIFAGDSAGANLNLACAMRCIEMGVRRPDGIFLAYCPVLISFVPSPARMLCLMDPLLPFGFMMRCLKAYACPSKEILEQNKKRYEERLAIMNAATPSVPSISRQEATESNVLVVDGGGTQPPTEDEIKSDHSESPDNSTWDHLNSLNSIQPNNQHLSPVSDTVSDTLALKSQTAGNTIDLMSPDESNTLTSLEEDSQPITLQQVNLKTEQSNVTVVDDLDMDLPSDISSEQNTNRNVSEFIDRYILDTRTNDAGELEPILRPCTSADENAEADIGKEVLNMQVLQEKVSSAAINLVSRVSSTISTMTTSNNPIASSSSQAQMQNNMDVLIARSPSDEFIFDVPRDSHLSPYWASDEVLSQFPPTKILTVVLDPCLDDCVMFAKRLKKLNNPVSLDILPGLPHGFLNFAGISKDANEGSKKCIQRIAELLKLPAPMADETRVKNCC